MHLYWAVDCKTPGCKRRQVFKDMVFASDQSDDPTMQISMPHVMKLRCTTCGHVYSYVLNDVHEFQSEDTVARGFEIQM